MVFTLIWILECEHSKQPTDSSIQKSSFFRIYSNSNVRVFEAFQKPIVIRIFKACHPHAGFPFGLLLIAKKCYDVSHSLHSYAVSRSPPNLFFVITRVSMVARHKSESSRASLMEELALSMGCKIFELSCTSRTTFQFDTGYNWSCVSMSTIAPSN